MKHTGRREGKLRLAGSVRARRAERTREQILRAGLKVFSSKGFERATMDDIALELEATKGLLYYHFKTKEQILSAILKQSPVIAMLEAGLRALEGLPFAQSVRAAVHGSMAVLEAHRDFIRFLHIQALLSGKEAEVVYTEVIDRLRQSVAAGIERFKKTGEVKPDADATHWSNMMVSLVVSYFLQNQVFGQSHKLGTDYLDYMVDMLVGAIGTGKAKSPGSEGK